MLAAYVRENSQWDGCPGGEQSFQPIPTDMQAILAVLGRLNTEYEEPEQRLDLHSTNLQGASLMRAKLQWAILTNANIQRASLSGSNLLGAMLTNADLHGTDLSFANLHGVNFNGTNLQDAVLFAANLEDAYLVLQSQIRKSSLVMATPGSGLVASSPPRPIQDEIRQLVLRLYEAGEQSSHFRHCHGNQLFIRAVVAPLSPCSMA